MEEDETTPVVLDENDSPGIEILFMLREMMNANRMRELYTIEIDDTGSDIYIVPQFFTNVVDNQETIPRERYRHIVDNLARSLDVEVQDRDEWLVRGGTQNFSASGHLINVQYPPLPSPIPSPLSSPTASSSSLGSSYTNSSLSDSDSFGGVRTCTPVPTTGPPMAMDTEDGPPGHVFGQITSLEIMPDLQSWETVYTHPPENLSSAGGLGSLRRKCGKHLTSFGKAIGSRLRRVFRC